ncbi:hypothetical protein ACF1AE_03075 [Streptomyces sp. NPDC014986]|uniref:hypothetical protein n=1 Tax=Streptomyces sp. NPDC014986 TaxID=3364934 RepID=UPI0036F8F63E
MDQPWHTITLVMAAGATAMGMGMGMGTRILRYDPRDPRRVVVVHTKDGRPGKVSYPATANMTWGVFFLLFGVAVGVGAFL